MAQIRGVINQAHRNQDLETIKNMYHSGSARNIDNEENNNNNNGNRDQQNDELSEEDSDLDIIEDNEPVVRRGNWDTIVTMWSKMLDAEEDAEKEMKNEDMLENNNNFGDDTASAYLSNRIHPQRDNSAKWELGKLFSIDLDPPKYCEKL